MKSRLCKIILIGEMHDAPDGARLLQHTISYLKRMGKKISVGLEVPQFEPSNKNKGIATLLDPLMCLKRKIKNRMVF
jgi:hypothetical protein